MTQGEWTNPSVKNTSCAYAALGSYNNGAQVAPGLAYLRRPSMRTTYVEPSFSPPPGYNTVSRTQIPTCNGYSNMAVAYGNAGIPSCGVQYVTNLCSAGSYGCS